MDKLMNASQDVFSSDISEFSKVHSLDNMMEISGTCIICTSYSDDLLACSHCEKQSCAVCLRQCEGCLEIFCQICSRIDYSTRFEKCFCYECYTANQQKLRGQKQHPHQLNGNYGVYK